MQGHGPRLHARTLAVPLMISQTTYVPHDEW